MHAAPLQITQIRNHLAGTFAPTMWMTYLCSVHQQCPPSIMTAPSGRKIISIFSRKNVSASLLPILTQTFLIEGTICLCLTNPGERTENTYFFWYKPNMSLPCIGLYYTGYDVKVSHLQKGNVDKIKYEAQKIKLFTNMPENKNIKHLPSNIYSRVIKWFEYTHR